MEDLKNFEARPGTIWVCGVCRRTSTNRAVWSDKDTSCFMHAILCDAKDLTFDDEGRAQEVCAAEYL